MNIDNRSMLVEAAKSLRHRLEQGFGPETAAQGFQGTTPSTGQCAAASTIIHRILGGELVSARVSGVSHWFNRITIGDKQVDLDLTGDQFGFPPIQISEAGHLYDSSRVRLPGELNVETLCRARLLAERAHLAEAQDAIAQTLRERATKGNL